MTREEQIAARDKGENVTTTTGNATARNDVSVAEKVEENKIEVPAEEPAVEDTVATEEVADKEPEITATTSSESQMNFDPDVKLSDVIPISLDGIDAELGSTSTVNDIPIVETSAPLEAPDVNMFNTTPSINPWETSKEAIVQENQSFINNEPTFDNNDQFVKSSETSNFVTSNESDKILEFIASTRKAEKKEIVRHNAITTNPEVAVQVIDGFFDNFPYEEAKERSKEYVFNQTTALGITKDQLKKVDDEEPLHSSSRERNKVVFQLNDGEISTDEFPGFRNKFSKMNSEDSFVDQQSTIVPFPGNNYGMQQADMYGNIIQNGFGDEDQNLNNDIDNKPFAA